MPLEAIIQVIAIAAVGLMVQRVHRKLDDVAEELAAHRAHFSEIDVRLKHVESNCKRLHGNN